MATKLVKKALGARVVRPGNQTGNKVFKARSVSAWIQKPVSRVISFGKVLSNAFG